MCLHFSDVCLQPGTIGGFESDSISVSWHSDDSFSTVDGKCNGQKVPQKVAMIAPHDGLSMHSFIHFCSYLLTGKTCYEKVKQ